MEPFTFRELFFALVQHPPVLVYEEVLAPAIDGARSQLDQLARFRRLVDAPPIARDERGELAEWYALSRVLDYLLLSFSPPSDDREAGSRKARAWRHTNGEIVRGAFDLVSLADYRRFVTAIGLEPIDPVAFSPIHSEIVQVIEDATAGDAIVLDDELWPGLRFGELIVSRGGAVVRASPHVLARRVAEASTLYGTYWRSYRPTEDRSRGWGSNSQWSTAFRRDYQTATHRHYNVDGDFDVDRIEARPPLLAPPTDLTRDERIAFITHRCLVRPAASADERWVYDGIYVEPVT